MSRITQNLSVIADLIGKVQILMVDTMIGWMPKQKNKPPDFLFGWREYNTKVRTWHHILSICSVATTLAVLSLILKIPGMHISMLGIFAEGIDKTIDFINGADVFLYPYFYLFGIFFIVLFRDRIISSIGSSQQIFKNLPYHALREERECRAGAEHWSFWERVRSSIIFGLLHFGMIVIPIGVCLALSIAGIVFMIVYVSEYNRSKSVQMALTQSAIVHTTYNRYAYASIFVAIPFYIILAFVL